MKCRVSSQGGRQKTEEMKKRKRKHCCRYLYLLGIAGTEFIKVGKTDNLKQRFSQYKLHNPQKLQLVRLFELDSKDCYAVDKAEQAVLDQFMAYQVRGEWFSIPEEFRSSFLVYVEKTCVAGALKRIETA